MPEDEQRRELLEHTTKIVAAHGSHNPIAAAELPSVIATVHQTLATLGPEEPAEASDCLDIWPRTRFHCETVVSPRPSNSND